MTSYPGPNRTPRSTAVTDQTRAEGADVFRVVIAPDKFKGSLAATEVADIVASALFEHAAQHPAEQASGHRRLEVVQHPIADGGEGTVALALASGFSPVTTTVTGPLGTSVEATLALRDDVAVVEMASAAGLALLPDGPSDTTAWSATTHGVGELILAAVDHGATQVVVGAGGSATSDGGAGAVEALGVDVTRLGHPPHDQDGIPARLETRLSGVDLVVACDVDNPLLGPDGVANSYAAQKGAGPTTRHRLEDRLTRWADAVTADTGKGERAVPGVGAAGGLAYGLVALAGARIVSGVELLLELTDFDSVAATADLIIVGEGSLDEQSMRGKGPIGVARAAASGGTTVVAVAGRNLLEPQDRAGAGLARVYALTDIEPDENECMAEARTLLTRLSHRLAHDWLNQEAATSAPRGD